MLRAVVMALAGAGLQRKIAQLRRTAIYYSVAGLALAIGLIFLLVAAYIFCAQRYGALQAALGFGAVFVLLALITMAIYGLRGGGRATPSTRRKIEEERAEQMKAMATAIAVGAAPAIIRSMGLTGAIVLPLAALAAYLIYKENTPPPPPPDGED